MKRKLLALVITPVFLVIMAFKPTNTIVSFEQTDWDNSKSKAVAEGKLYFVDFDASYCATCRNMDESTYMDERLAYYMKQNVVALRVDVQDFDGVMWSQQYEVEALPTMLIFDAKGKLVKRLVGYKSATDLVAEFDKIKNSTATNTTTTATNTTATPSSKTIVTANKIVVPQPIEADKPMSSTTTTKPVNSSNTFLQDEFLNAAPQPTGMGLYEVTVRKQSSEGFSVQTGVFTTYDGVLEDATKLQQKYNKKTIIHIDQHNGSTVYKLLIGTFEDKRAASAFRQDLRKDNIDGLIKDLKLMK